jgi:hypothetical protein
MAVPDVQASIQIGPQFTAVNVEYQVSKLSLDNYSDKNTADRTEKMSSSSGNYNGQAGYYYGVCASGSSRILTLTLEGQCRTIQ